MSKKKGHVSKFFSELKKETRLAFAAAVGFIIAFAWKDYILKLVSTSLGNLYDIAPHLSGFLTAIIITIIGVLLIMLSSRLLE